MIYKVGSIYLISYDQREHEYIYRCYCLCTVFEHGNVTFREVRKIQDDAGLSLGEWTDQAESLVGYDIRFVGTEETHPELLL